MKKRFDEENEEITLHNDEVNKLQAGNEDPIDEEIQKTTQLM